MSPRRQRRESEAADLAKRALERGATTLGAQVARSVQGGWQRMSPARRAKLEQLAASIRERTVEPHAANVRARAAAPPAAEPPSDWKAPEPSRRATAARPGEPEVTEVEVRDLRADLARELERLAEANIHAARGPGDNVAGEAASADGQA